MAQQDQSRVTGSAAETEALGEVLGLALVPGDLLLLDGDLGAGKTCFVRGLGRGVGADPLRVRSPTFVFHHVYRGARLTLHHIDCYRLGPGADLRFLDLDGLLEEGAVAIEWGSYAADLDGDNPARLEIAIGAGDQRRLNLSAAGPALEQAWSSL